MNTIGLFPTPLVTDNIREHLDQQELKQLTNLTQHAEDLLDHNHGNKFHKNTYLLHTLPVTRLNELLTKRVNDFRADVMGESRTRLVITQSWININPPGSQHSAHRHKNSIVSGVLYINCDQNSGNVKFHNNQLLTREVGGEVDRHNPFTYEFVSFTPDQFDLYLFPSNLKHSVDINKSNINRLSLAFNTFYSGMIDDGEELSQLTVN